MSLPFSIGSTRAGYQDVGDDVAVLDVNSCRAEDTGYTGNDGTKRRVSWQVRDAKTDVTLVHVRMRVRDMLGSYKQRRRAEGWRNC